MKKVWIVIISVVVVAVVVGAGTYYFTNRAAQTEKENLRNQINELQSQAEPSQVEEETTETEGTSESNLETYKSSEYGYSFSYPKTWDLKKVEGSGNSIIDERITITKKDDSQTVTQSPNGTGSAEYIIDVIVSPKNEYSSLEDYISDLAKNKESATLGGLEATSYREATAPSSGLSYCIANYSNNRIYEVRYGAMAEASTHLKLKSVYDDVVDSFEFTN